MVKDLITFTHQEKEMEECTTPVVPSIKAEEDVPDEGMSYSAMCVLEKITAVRFAAAIAAKLNPQSSSIQKNTTSLNDRFGSNSGGGSVGYANSSNSGSGSGIKHVGYAKSSNSSNNSSVHPLLLPNYYPGVEHSFPWISAWTPDPFVQPKLTNENVSPSVLVGQKRTFSADPYLISSPTPSSLYVFPPPLPPPSIVNTNTTPGAGVGSTAAPTVMLWNSDYTTYIPSSRPFHAADPIVDLNILPTKTDTFKKVRK
eukprot:gene24680-32146_t